MRGALVLLTLAAVACSGTGTARTPADTTATQAAPRGFEPPVATNPEPPVHYPPRLYDQTVEGTVMLRLFVDATGQVVPESTRIGETSGYPALDSAALAGVPAMTFAPARRNGVPVAAAFLQPVYFRHPNRRGSTESR